MKQHLETAKLSINKVIKKAIITWNISFSNPFPIYYVWKNTYINKKIMPFIVIDYHPRNREWYVTIVTPYINYHSTIDDVTGRISITKSNNII